MKMNNTQYEFQSSSSFLNLEKIKQQSPKINQRWLYAIHFRVECGQKQNLKCRLNDAEKNQVSFFLYEINLKKKMVKFNSIILPTGSS